MNPWSRAVSASITMTTSLSPSDGSRSASTWFSAPAFFSVLPTVSNHSTPVASATATVPSVQLSATTMTRSGRRDWERSAGRVDGRIDSSSCDGIRTVTVTGLLSQVVCAMRTTGASGVSSGSSDLRDRAAAMRSTSATLEAASTAIATAAQNTRAGGRTRA